MRVCVQVCGFAAKLVACWWSVVGGLASSGVDGKREPV